MKFTYLFCAVSGTSLSRSAFMEWLHKFNFPIGIGRGERFPITPSSSQMFKQETWRAMRRWRPLQAQKRNRKGRYVWKTRRQRGRKGAEKRNHEWRQAWETCSRKGSGTCVKLGRFFGEEGVAKFSSGIEPSTNTTNETNSVYIYM